MTTLVPEDVARPPEPPLWGTPGLTVLFTASTTARLANEAARVAVVLLVLSRTGSPALAGALVAALTLPQLLSGPVLGAWLDQTTHRRTAFVANQTLMPLVLVALLAVTGHAASWVVIALGTLAGITAPVLTGGFTGLIAPLVPPELLRRAYGVESTSYNIGGVVGPSLAGALAGWFSAEVATATAAGLSLVALIAVLRVPMPPPVPGPRPALMRSVAAGLALLARTPTLRSVTVATTLSFGGIGSFAVVFPSLAVEVGATAAASGGLFSAFCVGALAGSLLVSARTPKTGPLRLALLGIAGLAVTFSALALAPTFGVALVLVTLAGVCEGPIIASTLTIREQFSPAQMRTQVVTTAASIKFGAYAAGSAVAGYLVARSGATAGVWFLASCQLAGLLAGCVALGWPTLRSRFSRPHPPEVTPASALRHPGAS